MNERPYHCCGNLPSEGHTATCPSDEAWDAQHPEVLDEHLSKDTPQAVSQSVPKQDTEN